MAAAAVLRRPHCREQPGELRGVSRATKDRWWSFSRAWLYDAVNGGDSGV